MSKEEQDVNTTKVRFSANIGFASPATRYATFTLAQLGIEQRDWDEMDEKARDKFIYDECYQWAAELLDCGWEYQ